MTLNWMVLVVTFMGVITVAAVFMASNPAIILYGLALVVSLVGLNIHIGFTINLSRVILVIFLFSYLVRLALGKRGFSIFQFESRYIILFYLIILVQLISALFSSHTLDGLRQIFIYLSMMAIFVTVIIVGTRTEIVLKAIKIYLTIGLVQGLYGMYQVIGSRFGWPTYQTLMVGIPTANDRTVGGYVYSGGYGVFRATGFFPADVSQYAGYMVGILLLAISLTIYNRRSLFSYLVILVGGIGLLASLSRSGIIAFFVIGLPTLLFLLCHVHSSAKWLWRPLAIWCVLLVVLGGGVKPLFLDPLDIKLPNTIEIVSTRLNDLLSPGVNNYESMKIHIATRLMALKAFASSPLIGVGLGVNASPWYSEDSKEAGWAGAHSHHLDILGQTGLLGASLQWVFMALVGLYMWSGLNITSADRQERIILSGLLAAYIAILIGNFLYHYFMSDFVWFLMGCGVALSREIRRKYIFNAKGQITANRQVAGDFGHRTTGNTF